MVSEEEQLRERLRWLKEVRRLNEDERHIYSNAHLQMFLSKILPKQYQEMKDAPDEAIEEAIERLERDLEDARKGEFRVE